MTLIIPGVEVQVVKDVLPPQLSPSGVLGLVTLGTPSKDDAAVPRTIRAASWAALREHYGPACAFTMPEARQALENGVRELVVVPAVGGTAAKASLQLDAADALSAPLTDGIEAFKTVSKSLETLGSEAPGSTIMAGLARTAASLGQTLDFLAGLGVDTKDAAKGLAALPAAAAEDGDLSAADALSKAIEEAAGILETLKGAVPGIVTLRFTVRAVGGWANDVGIKAAVRAGSAGSLGFDLTIARDAAGEVPVREVYRGLTLATLTEQLDRRFSMARAVVEPAAGDKAEAALEAVFAGGEDPEDAALIDALDRLEDEPDVDLVMVAVETLELAHSQERLARLHAKVMAHCTRMSGRSAGRIGFGTVPAGLGGMDAAAYAASWGLVSDRFVLVAPHGTAGAVVGLVGSLPYYESPTFKALAGLGGLAVNYPSEAQEALLKGGVLPVALHRGRGIIVVRGITTDLDQISVRRVADRAVRGLKSIGDQFIGRLNTLDGRIALKQKLTSFLLQMERENAIVPSTDGKSRAFQVAVYSSQEDFAQGIVRVDMAVRPVRAIDYIYATVLVQL